MKVTQSLKENPTTPNKYFTDIAWISMSGTSNGKIRHLYSCNCHHPYESFLFEILLLFCGFSTCVNLTLRTGRLLIGQNTIQLKRMGETNIHWQKKKNKKQPKKTQPLHSNTSTFVYIILHLYCILDDSKNSWFPITENILCFEDMFLISMLV